MVTLNELNASARGCTQSLWLSKEKEIYVPGAGTTVIKVGAHAQDGKVLGRSGQEPK